MKLPDGSREGRTAPRLVLRYTTVMEITFEEIREFLGECHIFAKVTDRELDAAAEFIEVFSVPAGEVLFRPGMKSDGLYFVFRGKIRINAPSGKGTAGVSRTLSAGAYFGEESLIYGQNRLTQAVVRTPAVILRISDRSLQRWIDEYPAVITPLRLVRESFQLVYNRSFAWLSKGEIIQFAARRTRFILWKKLLFPAALLSVLLTLTVYLAVNGDLLPAGLTAALLLLLAPWAAWLYFDWRNDFLVVTNHRVVTQEKVILLYDTRHETPLEAVQAFGLETDQWGRWFGFGTIVVRSFTGNQLLKEIENPAEVITILEEALDRAQSRRKEEDRKAAEAAVKARLGLEPEKSSPKRLPEEASFFEGGIIPGWIANLFQVRIESGDTITYRTHWVMLIKSLFFPTLGLLLIPAAAALSYRMETLPISKGTWTLAAGLAAMFFFGVWLYRYIDWHNDCYMITPDQIIDVYRKPLGIEERRTASYSSILGVEYTRKGLSGLIFNYGTVNIKVGDSNFTFDDVYNPSVVQQELFQKLNRFTLRQKNAAADDERQRMADLIESYHHARGQDSWKENAARGGEDGD